MSPLLPLLALLVASPATALDWRDNRIAPLQKVTVGPSDNFQAAVDPFETELYFTRNHNQIPSLHRQDLATGEVLALFAPDTDAKDPALHPGGRLLAVTSFRHDAQGDVCVLQRPGTALECITGPSTLDRAPFWIDEQHLGFLSRAIGASEWQLVEYNRTTGASRVRHQGAIAAPHASPDGRYIVYTDVSGGARNGLRILDRQSGRLHTPPGFDLPGITGFSTFSRDGRQLYFTHYLNDTSFDQTIDANDHSVIYRVPFAILLSAREPIYPEQLTSVSENCNFPAAGGQHLYVTCAFEGSLDIYRAPLEGTVPRQWAETTLWEAYRTARSHEERLLLLNTLRYRHGHDDTAMGERLLSHHLELNELSAARYYVRQLGERQGAAGREDLARFYTLLDGLLQVRADKAREPPGVVTARFRRGIAEARQRIARDAPWERLRWLMEAYLDVALGDEPAALAKLQGVPLSETTLPLERYLAFELYRQLLEERDLRRLLGLYPLMFNDAGLGSEAQLYYAYHFLRQLARVESDLARRIAEVEARATTAAHGTVAELFRAEAASLRLAASHDQAEQGQRVRELMALLRANRNDALARRILHVRAIQNLAAAERFELMELLSRNWVTTTHVSETEFVNVAEQYALITLDKAYGLMADGELAKAYTTFYSAIRQTNDLEAHYQFVTLGLNPATDRRENLTLSYEVLEKEGIVGANRDYVAVLLLLADPARDRAAVLKEAAERLEALRPAGLNPAMGDLLLGYVYHGQLRATLSGYRYDKALFQKAHHRYMQALDLAFGNSRITAAVLENLGWLHFTVRNYALSADFFGRRMGLPFATAEGEALARWGYARALFYRNDLPEAAREADLALVRARAAGIPAIPFVEKAAFYALQAADYAAAADHYRSLLQDPEALKGANRAKAQLALGYAQLRSGERAAAATFEEVLRQLEALPASPGKGEGLVAFRPERLQLLAYGFLAQATTDPAVARACHTARLALFRAMAGREAEFAYDEAGRLSFEVKALHHLAVAYHEAGLQAELVSTWESALAAAGEWVKASGSATGPVAYRTLMNYLSFGLLAPQPFAAHDSRPLAAAIQAALDAFDEQPYQTPLDVLQRAKLALLWTGYRAHVLNETEGLAERVQALLTAEPVLRVAKQLPDRYRELQGLGEYVRAKP